MKTIVRLLFVSLTFLASLMSVKAQVDAPEFRCIFVEDNGDITLTWVPPADPNNQFSRYQIYVSVQGTPFAPVVSNITNRLQNTFTILGAGFPNPTLKNYKYYIVSEYNDGGTKISPPSDTLTVMELVATKTSPNEMGTLTWNSMRTNPLPTWSAKYDLGRNVREFVTPPPGIWNDQHATPDYGIETFVDTLVRCSSIVAYRVQLDDASGCTSRSNTVVEPLVDNIGAATMTYDQVTVRRTFPGGVELKWSPHADGSVVSYIIIYVDPLGVSTTLDTVSAATTTYNDFNHDPNLGNPLCYLIAPLDSCGKTNGGGTMHCTMFLNDSTDRCEGAIFLDWTPYKGWGQVDSYYVYMRSNVDTTYRVIGSVGGSDTTFKVENLNPLYFYTFYVEGRDGTGRFWSHSNLRGAAFNNVGSTKYLHLRSASVLPDNRVELRVLMDRSTDISHLNIYRGVDRKGPFKLVGKGQPPVSPIDSFFSIYDNQARPDQINYVYQVEVMDLCNKPVRRSNLFRTIYLSGNSDKDLMENFLEWTANIYVDSSSFDQDIYQLYRGVNRRYGFNPIRVKFAGENFHTDDISDQINEGATFCYTMRLVQYPSDTFTLADTVSSNEVCFQMDPNIFVPNSFSPNEDGLNEVWRPVTRYVVPVSNYLLRVFDRWGNLIFETTDPLAGWDGKFNGADQPIGSYAFRLEVTTVFGSQISERGSFNLLR